MACLSRKKEVEGIVEGLSLNVVVGNWNMVDEQLEFAISQYADGTLPTSQRAALEARLASDAALMELLREYRQIGMAIESASPLPAINWDRLTVHLSERIAE